MNRRVHLVCSPFPSPQGTQGAIASMLAAEAAAGLATELVAYPEWYGEAARAPVGYPIRRLPRMPLRVGARSGPSLARIAHDLAAVPALRALVRDATLPPRELVLAHNVEAAMVCAIAGVRFTYVAHTSMRDELPTYPGHFGAARRALGEHLDRLAVTHAESVAAVAPALARDLARRYEREVVYVPIPWGRALAPGDAPDRDRARAALGIPEHARVVLHAGNLDGYQGLADVVAAARAMTHLARARDPGAAIVLLVATCSDPQPLRGAASGLALRFAPLATEEDRQRAHASADVALLARSAAGGLPIKLLEAFARGVPVVATRTSIAGLEVERSAVVVEDGDAHALARAAVALLFGDEIPRRKGAATEYLAAHHADAAYLAAAAIAARAPR